MASKKTDAFLDEVDQKAQIPTSPVLRGQSAVRASLVDHKPNMTQLVKFILTMGLVWFSLETTRIFQYVFIYWSAYYGWLTSEEQQLQQYYVNIIENCFTAAGAVLAGILMVRGRKLTVQIGLLVIAIGFIPSFILNWPLYLCSRAIVAIGIGLAKATGSRFAEEYLPLAYYGAGNAAI